MFQSFIYLRKRLFWVNAYFMSQFFLTPLVFLTSVSLLRCYDFELVLRNFDCSLEFVFSLLLLQPFNFSPVSFACNFQDWGCVILREIDFLLKICWSIACLHSSWKVHNSIEIRASLNHRKKTKADGSRLIPRKHTETLVLLRITGCSYLCRAMLGLTDWMPNRNLLIDRDAGTKPLNWDWLG